MDNNIKIRILTFHSAYSYGAVLQCYALFTYLKTKYADVKVIDFRPPTFSLRPSLKNPKSVILSYKFNRFKNEIAFTKNVTAQTLRTTPPDADIYIIGSDQVWNPYITKEFQDIYFGDFIPSNKTKITYAASFGLDSFPSDVINNMRKYVHNFNAVSVRESSGIKLCKDYFDIEAECIIDPVFLLDSKDFIKSDNVRVKDELALFMLDNDSNECFDFAKDISQQLSLKPKIINKNKPVCRMKIIPMPSIHRFLKEIYRSKFIVTNSFHGLAFSIIFNKDFLFISTKKQKAPRAVSLLSKLGLLDRLFYDYNSAITSKIYKKSINYSDVNNRLNILKAKAYAFLDSSINLCH